MAIANGGPKRPATAHNFETFHKSHSLDAGSFTSSDYAALGRIHESDWWEQMPLVATSLKVRGLTLFAHNVRG